MQVIQILLLLLSSAASNTLHYDNNRRNPVLCCCVFAPNNFAAVCMLLHAMTHRDYSQETDEFHFPSKIVFGVAWLLNQVRIISLASQCLGRLKRPFHTA